MLVYIKPLSIFPELHSDTLFGALTFAINQLYPDKTEIILEEFKNNVPFFLSSPFPFIYGENDEKVKFFPKINLNKRTDKKDSLFDEMKKYKKIKFVEEEIFYNIINGKLNESDILNNYSDYSSSGSFLMKKSYDDFRLTEDIIPNNSVNRLFNTTEGIFYSEGQRYLNMGLFFYIEFNDEKYIPIIKSALKFLKDRGFGKDISTGKGQFEYEIYDESIKDVADAKYFINLSRFIPSEYDLENIDGYSVYEIDSKRGRCASGEIRKQVRFFKEGSIFKNYSDSYGTIVAVGDINPAIEYGIAFPVKTSIDLGGN